MNSNLLVFSDGGVRGKDTAATGWVIFAREPTGIFTRLAYRAEFHGSSGKDSMEMEGLAFEAAVNWVQRYVC